MIGLTSLNPMDLWPLNNTVHVRLSELQSYGALNPDYRTTALGNFLLDIDLSPSEGTVLWTYIQEHWDRGKSCLSVMLLTSMISLFSSTQNYFEYKLPEIANNLEKTKYKIDSLEELFVFTCKYKQFIQHLNIRYCEVLVSAYKPYHQKLFLNIAQQFYSQLVYYLKYLKKSLFRCKNQYLSHHPYKKRSLQFC